MAFLCYPRSIENRSLLNLLAISKNHEKTNNDLGLAAFFFAYYADILDIAGYVPD